MKKRYATPKRIKILEITSFFRNTDSIIVGV